MGSVTLRLNTKEESVLQALQNYFDEDKSRIIKRAMFDAYEQIKDLEVIENFEYLEEKGQVCFSNADSLLQKLKSKK